MSDATFYKLPCPLSDLQRQVLLLAGAPDAGFVFVGSGPESQAAESLVQSEDSRRALLEVGEANIAPEMHLRGFRRLPAGQALVDARTAAGGWR